MEAFAKIRKITRTLPHSKAPFEEHQNLTYEDAHEMPSPESCLKETYTCSHIYPLHWLARNLSNPLIETRRAAQLVRTKSGFGVH
jgi:hypothetical protein